VAARRAGGRRRHCWYGRLFASGADSKHIRVYDARSGDELEDYFAGDDTGFINDVIVTKRGA
jgi:hypothetical protein